MRAYPRPRLRSAFSALGILLALALLAGCAPSGSQSTQVSPQSQALFHTVQTYPNIPVIRNLTYRTVDGTALKLDVCVPTVKKGERLTPRPAIIGLHGGSWAAGDKGGIEWRAICQWLASDGWVAAIANYRLAPAHPYPAAISDVETAVEWLRAPAQVKRFSIDPTLIGAFGGSAGADLVSLLGTTGSGSLDSGHRVAAVAELSGPVNLTAGGYEYPYFRPFEERYLHCATLTNCPQARTASPYFHIDPSDPPFFVAHSLHERIPLSQSESFVSKLRANGIDTTFVTVSGDLHSISMLDEPMRERIAAFFAAKLVHPVIGAVRASP